MHRTLVAIASLAVLPLATTACSGGGSSGGSHNEPAATTTSGAEARSAPAEKTGEQASEADEFGVTMLYPSAPGGESWFLSDDATNDPRFDPQNQISPNEDGSWKMRNGKVRMEVFTSPGFDPTRITTYDREALATQGYMQDAHDWKNVEITGFVKVNHASKLADNFAWYARGGRHTDGGLGCEGSSYKGGLHYDGRVRFEKESWHVDYTQGPYEEATSSIVGRWVGFKTVMRNEMVDGKEVVHLELWLNDSGDKVSWSKVYDMIDDGTWGGDAATCGGKDPAMPITWGGPIATFRWDSAEDVDFKWMSVREIE